MLLLLSFPVFGPVIPKLLYTMLASFLKPQFVFPNVHLTFPLRWLTDIQNLICPELDSYPSSSKLIHPVLPISTDVKPFLPGFQARNLTVEFNLFCIPNQPLPTPLRQNLSGFALEVCVESNQFSPPSFNIPGRVLSYTGTCSIFS